MRTISANDITNASDKLSDTQRMSFVEQSTITPVLIERGDSLWRIISTKNKNKFSDYWIDSETMTNMMDVFRSWGDYSQKTKKAVVKDNLAVLSHWSKLNWRVKITFKKSVIAYKGKTGPQNHFVEDSKLSKQYNGHARRSVESRIGGFNQFVIPCFKGITSDQGNEFAEVTHFAHI